MSWLSRLSNFAISALKTSTSQPTKNLPQLTCSGCSSRLNLLERAAPFQPSLHQAQQQQVRYRYVDWRMWRDEKRRRLIKQHATARIRINAVRINTILPREIQEIADREINEFPRDSHIWRIKNRCVITSRPRGVVQRWRLSRIVWRHLADYNKLSGVTRASW